MDPVANLWGKINRIESGPLPLAMKVSAVGVFLFPGVLTGTAVVTQFPHSGLAFFCVGGLVSLATCFAAAPITRKVGWHFTGIPAWLVKKIADDAAISDDARVAMFARNVLAEQAAKKTRNAR